MSFFKKFLSRKFLVLVAGMISTALAGYGLPAEVAAEVAALLASLAGVYILGQSWEDGKVKPFDLEEE